MRILYLMRNALHTYPPCMSQIFYLNDLGVEVIVGFSECADETKAILDKKNIRYVDFGVTSVKIKKLGTLQSYYEYRRKAIRFIRSEYKHGDFLWCGTADSAFSLRGYIEKFPYVLSILELYDDNNFYRNQIARLVHRAVAVIACEDTRAAIMKVWWKLKQKPFVMPNKPYEHLRKRYLEGTTDSTRKAIQMIEGKKIVLYQGIISADRDLGVFAQAMNKLNREDVYLVLMGREFYNGVDKVKAIYNKTIYLGLFPAPTHLELTSYAMIGVANYDDSCLNNLFCAPNKIYEYSGFGLPMICSRSPGLMNTVERFSAGCCVNFQDVDAICAGIEEIMDNYDSFSQNAHRMFDEVDNLQTMREIVESLKE